MKDKIDSTALMAWDASGEPVLTIRETLKDIRSSDLLQFDGSWSIDLDFLSNSQQSVTNHPLKRINAGLNGAAVGVFSRSELKTQLRRRVEEMAARRIVFNHLRELGQPRFGEVQRNEDEEEDVDPVALIPAVFLLGGGYAFSTVAGTGHYWHIESGRAVLGNEIRKLAEVDRLASILNARAWSRQLAEGKITPAQFEKLFLAEIKKSHIRAYVMGRGGRSQMTQSDWGKLGNIIKEQYRYFRGPRPGGGTPLNDLVQMGSISKGQLERRATMYMNAAREAFEVGQHATMTAIGYIEVLWSLGAAEHCPDCIDMASLGWISIDELPQFPGDGRTQCMTNCRCYLRYRDAVGHVRTVLVGHWPLIQAYFDYFYGPA